MTICLLWLPGQIPGWPGPHNHDLQASQPLTNIPVNTIYSVLLKDIPAFSYSANHLHKTVEIKGEY